MVSVHDAIDIVRTPGRHAPQKNRYFSMAFHVLSMLDWQASALHAIAYQVDQVTKWIPHRTRFAWLTQPASNFPCWSAKEVRPMCNPVLDRAVEQVNQGLALSKETPVC